MAYTKITKTNNTNLFILFKEFVIASRKLSIALVASDLDNPAEDATDAIRSFLFTFNLLY